MRYSKIASQVYAIIRIIIGLCMVYHGSEIFEPKKIAEYAQWDIFKNFSQAYWIAHFGKVAEFSSGLMIAVGFRTTWASIVLLGTMLFICFFIGHGKIWYEDQHPFLIALFALQYLFVGPGIWSFDNRNNTD